MRRIHVVTGVAALALLWLARPAKAGPTPAFAPNAVADARRLAPLQRQERRFLQDAAASLRFESDAARLARSRSKNATVQAVAARLLERQDTEQVELLRLLHVREMAPPMLPNAYTGVLKRLGRAGGGKFDRIFMEEVALEPAQTDLAEFERMAAQTQDPQLQAWIERQLPHLRDRIALAQKGMPPAPREKPARPAAGRPSAA